MSSFSLIQHQIESFLHFVTNRLLLLKKIIVHNEVFYKVSETFIYRQIICLDNFYEIVLCANRHKPVKGFTGNFRKIKLFKFNFELTKFLNWILNEKAVQLLLSKINAFLHFNRLFLSENISLIHSHYGWNGIKILPIAKKFGVPLVVSFHGKDASAFVRNEEYQKQLIELFNYASAIIVSSEHMFGTLKTERWKNKVHFVPYGIDTELFKPTNRIKNNTDKNLKILHSGRLVSKKGVLDLIDVFSKLIQIYPSLTLSILGNGEELELCKQKVGRYNLEGKVIFYGAQPQQTVIDLMDESDIFVLNSRVANDGDMEGLPNAILEALSMKLAVVSTIHAGIPFVIENNVNGLLVNEKDNDCLFQAISRLIENPHLRYSLAEQGRKTIQERFTIELMKENIKRIFDNVLTGD